MLMVIMTSYAMVVYSAPESIAAFTASVFIIGTLIARLVSGVFMEKIGRKRLALIGSAFTIFFGAVYMVDLGLALLMVVRFLHGFTYGVFSTCMATIITSIVPKARKGEGIGYYMLSVTLAAAIGPFLGIFLSARFDMNVLFVLSIVMSVLTVLCTSFIHLDKPSDKISPNAAAEKSLAEDISEASVLDAPEIEAEYERIENSKLFADSARSDSEKGKERPIDRFLETKALPIAGVSGLIFFGYSALLTFLQPFAAQIGLTRAASVFFVFYAISMFITRPFTGRAFDRVGPRPVMIPAFVCFVAGMVLLGLSQNDWMLLGSALLLGFGVGTIQSCGLTMAVQSTPDSRLSLANSTFYILIDTGVGVGPLLLGILVPLIGYRFMYICMAGVAIVSLWIFLILTRKKNKGQYLA